MFIYLTLRLARSCNCEGYKTKEATMSTFYLTPFSRKERLFDDIFDNFFNLGIHGGTYHSPTESIDDSGDSVTLSIDLPGFNKSDISIEYKDDQLIVHAKSTEASNRQAITRRYPIKNIDIKQSTAELKNGILTLTLEKNEASKSQQLKIK